MQVIMLKYKKFMKGEIEPYIFMIFSRSCGKIF